MTVPARSIVILSTADWDSPVWTNKQHIAYRLAVLGWDVIYIESLGLRAPRPNRADLLRILRRLLAQLKPPKLRRPTHEQPTAVRILSPLILPGSRSNVTKRINDWLLIKQVKTAVDTTSSVLYTFSPQTYGLKDDFAFVVYHSVDLLHTIPLMDAASILSAERDLISTADVIAGSSRGVVRHLEMQGAKSIYYWPNVADLRLFRESWSDRKPHVLFAGNLTPTKIRTDWMLALANTNVEINIAGPIGIDGTNDRRLSDLLQHPCVHYHGVLSQPELAHLAGQCSVGVIPYELNDYTSGVFPMKVFEYLAAGLAVISSALPSLTEELIDNIYTCNNGDQFIELVGRHLFIPSMTEAMSRSESARNRSWDNRIAQIEEVMSIADGQ